MSFLKKLFRGESKKWTVLDELHAITVRSYRTIAVQRGCAPTAKTSDEKILEIYSSVATAFRQVAEQRGERIPALNLNFIVWKFLQVYEMMGEQMLQEHLQYEVEKYLASGLRPDYLRELRLVSDS